LTGSLGGNSECRKFSFHANDDVVGSATSIYFKKMTLGFFRFEERRIRQNDVGKQFA
jgi:predicted membrane-bound dolichyl-phosphate-mannose-protein mannosyltransferase